MHPDHAPHAGQLVEPRVQGADCARRVLDAGQVPAAACQRALDLVEETLQGRRPLTDLVRVGVGKRRPAGPDPDQGEGRTRTAEAGGEVERLW